MSTETVSQKHVSISAAQHYSPESWDNAQSGKQVHWDGAPNKTRWKKNNPQKNIFFIKIGT